MQRWEESRKLRRAMTVGATRVLFGALLALITNLPAPANAQTGCAKDDLGRIACAPPGGVAVKSFHGILCAPGHCATDNAGYLKCSGQLGGGVAKDDLGRVTCVGGCVTPTKDFCVTSDKEIGK